jgi:uncharacterized protein (DUF2236 family)
MTGTIGGGAGPEASVPPLMGAACRADRQPSDVLTDPATTASPQSPSDDDRAGHRGIFGPETVTWRIHADPLIGLATLRSLALRVLHPEGLSSVFATARRVDDPWDRLAWTMRHLGVVTFGNSVEAAVSSARMRAVLMQVRGTTAAGQEYRGDDPELLLWSHCCQVASFVEVTRRGGLELTDQEHETYVREQVRMAALSGLEPDQVPASRRDLTRYFRSVRPRMRMTAAGRAFIGAIVAPTVPELMALTQPNRPTWAPVSGLTYPALPNWARRLYQAPPSSGPASLSQSATTIALHTLRDSLRGRPDQTGLGLT